MSDVELLNVELQNVKQQNFEVNDNFCGSKFYILLFYISPTGAD